MKPLEPLAIRAGELGAYKPLAKADAVGASPRVGGDMKRLSDKAEDKGRSGLGGKRRGLLLYGVIVVVAAWLYHVADGFGASDVPGRIGPDAWPKIALGLLIFTACLGFVKALLSRPASRNEKPAELEDVQAVFLLPELYPGLVWASVAVTVVYIMAWSVLGFFLATILYGIVLMWIGGQRRLGVLCGAGVGFALFFLFVFMKVVYVALPLGQEPFSQVSLGLMSLLGIH